jgi:hypothetical protein
MGCSIGTGKMHGPNDLRSGVALIFNFTSAIAIIFINKVQY